MTAASLDHHRLELFIIRQGDACMPKGQLEEGGTSAWHVVIIQQSSPLVVLLIVCGHAAHWTLV